MPTVFSKHHIVAAVLALTVIVAPSAFSGEEAGRKTFMWKATSPTATVYLQGSVHLGSEAFYPLPAEVEAAFKSSSALVVEINVDAPDMLPKMMKLVQEKGRYQNGETLSAKLSPATAALLKAYCEKKSFPLEQVDQMRPWLFGMTLAVLEAQSIGLKPELGIDKHFLNLAKETKKPIKELETVESQIGVMADFPDDLQEKMLTKSLEEASSMKEKLEKIIAAWKAGDDKLLNELMVTDELKKHPEFEPLIEKLLFARNVEMAEKIDGYLKGKETHFVVVGAGHLMGEKGLVALLKKKGYTVEQVLSAKP